MSLETKGLKNANKLFKTNKPANVHRPASLQRDVYCKGLTKRMLCTLFKLFSFIRDVRLEPDSETNRSDSETRVLKLGF